MPVELGIIEGYYGAPWTWADRREQAAFLAPFGYRFFIYAPKADPFLRRRWREEHPRVEAEELRRLARRCADLGVRFGVGLSPYEIYRDFNADAREALKRKLEFLDAVGVEQLAILFDDMRGDLPDLAATQVGIVHWIAERTRAKRIAVCPSYYADDPLLDRAFGQRPARYLEDFGGALDPAVDVFWTGEEVCSREFSPGHLERVGDQLRRRPLLWDNYPVNDGPRMSPYLHVRAFTGRPASIGPHIAGHGVNPALQPVLSRIPALSLAESYRLGERYQYGEAFRAAAELALGPDLARLAERHIGFFQDVGLDRLEPETAQRLRERYLAFDHPAAREVLAWLDGAYRITREMVEAS
jgi:hyaluronoglucosaminidase